MVFTSTDFSFIGLWRGFHEQLSIRGKTITHLQNHKADIYCNIEKPKHPNTSLPTRDSPHPKKNYREKLMNKIFQKKEAKSVNCFHINFSETINLFAFCFVKFFFILLLENEKKLATLFIAERKRLMGFCMGPFFWRGICWGFEWIFLKGIGGV
jgi:hypothetical protein